MLCLSNIHSFILHDCNQIPWAGSTDETIQITTLKIHGKKESIKVQTLDVANLPYTKLIMKERINVSQYRVCLLVLLFCLSICGNVQIFHCKGRSNGKDGQVRFLSCSFWLRLFRKCF